MLCKHNRLRPEQIRFVRLDSERAQSDRKSVTSLLDLARGRDSCTDQKERGLWGREWVISSIPDITNQ